MEECLKDFVPCFLKNEGFILCWVETGRYLTRLLPWHIKIIVV